MPQHLLKSAWQPHRFPQHRNMQYKSPRTAAMPSMMVSHWPRAIFVKKDTPPLLLLLAPGGGGGL
jgi:hypothetical protein